MNAREQLYMGLGEADITPDRPVQTVGFGRADETSRGVAGRLTAQAAVWRLGGETCLTVAVDHIGFSQKHALSLRDALGAAAGVGRAQVMLLFSHTHSAPNDSAEPRWFDAARAKILAAAETARGRMEPVRAAWGNAQTDIGLNRRPDGRALDRRIGVLKVCGADDGRLKLLLLRLTAHCNALKADNYQISPDYFGAVRDALREQYNCPVMLSQGASGNVAPRFFASTLTPPDAADGRFARAGDALARMAERVKADASPVIDRLVPRTAARLSMYSRFLDLTAEVPDEARARAVAEEARAMCGLDGRGWLTEVASLNARGVKEQVLPIEVQFFALGGGCLCGVSSEIMCECALEASDLLKDEFFYFGGYTNGCAGYLPTAEEFDKGGFEVYWSMLIYYMYYGRVFPFRRDSARRLVAFAAQNAPVREKE